MKVVSHWKIGRGCGRTTGARAGITSPKLGIKPYGVTFAFRGRPGPPPSPGAPGRPQRWAIDYFPGRPITFQVPKRPGLSKK